MIPYPEEQLKASFEAKYIPEPNSGCWLWLAALNNKGYPQIAVGQKRVGVSHRVLAHRLSFEWAKGEIPQGLVVDHLCRMPCCVNPDHLEAVTQRINVHRSVSATKTHCKRGHELTGDNLYNPPQFANQEHPARQCRTCRSLTRKQFWLKERK